MNLSAIDIQILALVQQDASLTAAEIAEKQGQYLHQRFSDKVSVEPPALSDPIELELRGAPKACRGSSR